MFLCQSSSTSLHIHDGTSWLAPIALSAPCSVAGSVDPIGGEVYIKTYNQAGFSVVSWSSQSVVRTITNTTSIGENTASGAYLAGSFYTRNSTGPVHALNSVTGALTTTTADPGGFYPGFAADHGSGIIYMLSDSTFRAYRPPTGMTTLAFGPSESTLATITTTY
jgi:hypothetical protein